jgi:hypothetical protein
MGNAEDQVGVSVPPVAGDRPPTMDGSAVIEAVRPAVRRPGALRGDAVVDDRLAAT